MLESMKVKNFTVFSEADFRFAAGLNVIVGENGSGKTHVMKVAYAAMAASREEGKKANGSAPTKAVMQRAYADKLVSVFRPEYLGRLVRRKQGRGRCGLEFSFGDAAHDCRFGFASSSKSEVVVEKQPSRWRDEVPVFLPSRELLTLHPPGFVSLYAGQTIGFDEIYRDTCLLLGLPVLRGARLGEIKEILAGLEEVLGGSVVFDTGNGRFYLNLKSGKMEVPLVAEGMNKIAMVAHLIANGSLRDKAYLFWDEPEANLNPKVIKVAAKTICMLCKRGMQVFISTHSLFLLRELEILLSDARAYKGLPVRYFGLRVEEGGTAVEQGESANDVKTLDALDEELDQSDRYLEMER